DRGRAEAKQEVTQKDAVISQRDDQLSQSSKQIRDLGDHAKRLEHRIDVLEAKPAIPRHGKLLTCLDVPSHWKGRLDAANGGSYAIELEFHRGTQTTVRYLGPDSRYHGPYEVTGDRQNSDIFFNEGPPNNNTWTLRCGVNDSLQGGLEVITKGSLTSTPTA